MEAIIKTGRIYFYDLIPRTTTLLRSFKARTGPSEHVGSRSRSTTADQTAPRCRGFYNIYESALKNSRIRCKFNSRNTSLKIITTSLAAAALTSVSEKSIIKEADDLYNQANYEGIYDLLLPYKQSNNDEILWRLGRATYEKARTAKDDADKKALYREALDHVEAALAINEKNFAVHKWMSILIDYVYAYEGTKQRIAQSYVVKDHMLRACELNPTDGTSRHLLGLWYYNIADIPWYQRKIASVVFSTPPSGTFQDALDQFLLAEKIEPDFYSKNYLFIAKCYLKLGNKNNARVYLEKTTKYSVKTLDDSEAVSEATKLLESI